MLASFTTRRTFNKLQVTLHVDRTVGDASLSVTYDRRLLRGGERVPYQDVETPDKAEAWLSRPMGERGSLVESLEWQARSGLLQPAEPVQ